MLTCINTIYLFSLVASTIKAITPNFTLGFGSFVDKPRVPYISNDLSMLVFHVSIVHTVKSTNISLIFVVFGTA